LLKDKDIEDSIAYAESIGITHQDLYAVLNSLFLSEYVELDNLEKKVLEISDEGNKYLDSGMPEFQYVNALTFGTPLEKKVVEEKLGKNLANIGFGKAMKNKWIKGDKVNVERLVETVVDEDGKRLQNFADDVNPDSHVKKELDDFKKRKLVSVNTIKFFKVKKGKEYREIREKLESDLTVDMLKSNKWKDLKFKDYNFNALGAVSHSGNLHPLLKVRAQFREILFEMGFEEMPTNQFVESSFWNFDALFQPQQHPARDMHDTFFLKDPAQCKSVPEDYCAKVKSAHETGVDGSIGYRYDWSLEESKKNILRTHTTAVSSKMLYKLAQQKEFTPKKYFSIDRVFRNETLDATHLAEFHQIEGVIADRNIGLSHLIGVLNTFFHKIGITKLKFKPAYNPYTEPSLEIFGFHPTLKRWVEIGNSGVFRPEMLVPMGLPKDVNVIAWGLSLERPTMIYYDISNIRDLFGHKVDISETKKNKICYINP
jgi:phenylalanyl-tRNA synthetase alpha chain